VQDIGSLIEDEDSDKKGGAGANKVPSTVPTEPDSDSDNNNNSDESDGEDLNESNVPDQEDREDDEDEEEETQGVMLKKVGSTEQGAYEQDVRESLTGPINL